MGLLKNLFSLYKKLEQLLGFISAHTVQNLKLSTLTPLLIHCYIKEVCKRHSTDSTLSPYCTVHVTAS